MQLFVKKECNSKVALFSSLNTTFHTLISLPVLLSNVHLTIYFIIYLFIFSCSFRASGLEIKILITTCNTKSPWALLGPGGKSMASLLRCLRTDVKQKLSLRLLHENCFTELKKSWSIFLTLDFCSFQSSVCTWWYRGNCKTGQNESCQNRHGIRTAFLCQPSHIVLYDKDISL